MRNPKFIIQEGKFKMGRVGMHFQLSSKDKKRPIGGGWFNIDKDNEKIYLYGESHDFGTVSKKELIEVINEDWKLPKLFKGYSVMFSTLGSHEGISKVKEYSEEIYKFN